MLQFWLTCAITLAVTPAIAGPELSSSSCPASHIHPLVLPRVKEALASNAELTIVAFGSSSTQGWHSSSIAQSYPAILQVELAASLPKAHVAVINRGVGGQDATEMVPRIQADVLNIRPALVIWQVGANGVLKNRDSDEFRGLVAAGVQTMQEANVDVVLMDNQRAPAIMASPHRIQIAQALADIAVRTGAGLFSRGTLMDQWRTAGHPYDQFVSSDGIHHNDLGYRCVARALATAILEGLGLPNAGRPVTARR